MSPLLRRMLRTRSSRTTSTDSGWICAARRNIFSATSIWSRRLVDAAEQEVGLLVIACQLDAALEMLDRLARHRGVAGVDQVQAPPVQRVGLAVLRIALERGAEAQQCRLVGARTQVILAAFDLLPGLERTVLLALLCAIALVLLDLADGLTARLRVAEPLVGGFDACEYVRCERLHGCAALGHALRRVVRAHGSIGGTDLGG